MFSFWEQQSFTEYDDIVIGAGIVGLSTAIELKSKYPNNRILVLERGFMSSGASSRNAGFACMGSASELIADLKTTSKEEVVQLFSARKQGLDILRKRLGDQAIGYAQNGSYELLEEKNIGILDHLSSLNEMLLPLLGKNAFELSAKKITDFGFNKQYCKAIIENTCEGEIHTGKMLRSLSDLALEKGIEIKNNAPVFSFEETNNSVSVFVSDQLRQDQWKLKCSRLFVCTNAFTPELIPNEPISPGRGQVLITQPIANLAFKGIFHFEEGYYYFRAIENRVLLGGGRNLDFDTETTSKLELNNNIQNHLEDLLRNLILPNIPFAIDQRWAGIMAFGPTKSPIVKALSNRIFGAFRMGGMGVALGSESARRLVHEYIHN